MKLADRIRAHPAVDQLSIEPDEYGTSYFVYLNSGWEWSGQKCFGGETLREMWSLVKEASKVDHSQP
jgi:hypothetical protein